MGEYRVVVIGAGGVGKSALTVRFMQGKFIERYDPTIEDSYRQLMEVDGTACMLDIMDTAGQDEYSALRDQYMKTGDGFLLVYSITSKQSFEFAGKLRLNTMRMKGENSNFPIVLVGNKKDLESERQVQLDEGKNLAEKWGVPFLETSAKSGENAAEPYSQIVRLINKWRVAHPPLKKSGKEAGKKERGRCQII